LKSARGGNGPKSGNEAWCLLTRDRGGLKLKSLKRQKVANKTFYRGYTEKRVGNILEEHFEKKGWGKERRCAREVSKKVAERKRANPGIP